MEITDIIPADGRPQRIYCHKCGSHTDLTYINFSEDVSGVRIRISGLPTLRCPSCGSEHLPDLSRFAIVNLHKEAFEKSSPTVNVQRRKREDQFSFTDVKFIYDPDDYYYIPGLVRPWDKGFLQPVFFKRRALLKFDSSPEYRVEFASTSYGTIYTDSDYISFGINRHGNLVMWLGDIAKLPESEQYYLRSENIESDHSIGSEFYDGQIEVKFTEPSSENNLFRLRSKFIESCHNRFGTKIAHLDEEIFDLARELNQPLVDTPKERRHVADTLNKIYIESFDSSALEQLGTSLGAAKLGTGSLKRLQAVFEKIGPTQDVGKMLSPLFALYDLRVAYSHLTPRTKTDEILRTVHDRLGICRDAELVALYSRLIEEMTQCFASLTKIVEAAEQR